jgi:hypothetical protein
LPLPSPSGRAGELGRPTKGTMPDRSYPGVYLEEFGPAKAIAGVATFIVGVLVGVAVSLVLDRLRRQCKQT